MAADRAGDLNAAPVIDARGVGKTFASQAGVTEALSDITLSIASG